MKQIQPFQKHWLQLTSIVVCRLKRTNIKICIEITPETDVSSMRQIFKDFSLHKHLDTNGNGCILYATNIQRSWIWITHDVEQVHVYWNNKRHHSQYVPSSANANWTTFIYCKITTPPHWLQCFPDKEYDLHDIYMTMETSSNGNMFCVAGSMRGIHRSPVNSPQKGQWRGALMFPLICA